MSDAKLSTIQLGASKTFLATCLVDDSGTKIVELLNDKQLEQIQDKFSKLSLPIICNLVVAFKHHAGHDYIDNILELKSKSPYDYIQECCFPGQIIGQKVFILKMLINAVGSGMSLVTQM